MQKKWIFIAAAIIVLLSSSLYVVKEPDLVLVRRLGEVVDVKSTPGLRVKVPFIDTVLFYDKRILDINLSPQEVIAKDRKRVIIDAFAKYRITDPLKFYQSVQNEMTLYTRFGPVLESSLREEVGRIDLVGLLSEKRFEVIKSIRKHANLVAKSYGIEIVDVRLRRTDLPEENSNAIYERMKSEHQKEALQTRAEGAEQAARTKSEADKERRVILAEAGKEANITRGEGDATATRIFAKAFSQDTDFFAFYRSMQAYRQTFNGDHTRMVLSPDSEFLRYLEKNR